MINNSIFTKQYYNNYTDEDFHVWKTLFNKQWDYLKDSRVACKQFYDGIEELNIDGNEIPRFSKLNRIIGKRGWKIKAVNGIVDDKNFFSCLENKIFPVTTWLRNKKQLNYIEEPDMFHDLFGHVPFLVHESYLNFLERMGRHAKNIFNINNKERQYQMSRFYWYTIEFGLIQNKLNGYNIYGAGILSSFEETQKSISNNSLKKEFNFDILSERFEKTDLQPFYAFLKKDLNFIDQLDVEKV